MITNTSSSLNVMLNRRAILGGFNRSPQHPILGGVDDNRNTQIRALYAAQIILARTAACLV